MSSSIEAWYKSFILPLLHSSTDVSKTKDPVPQDHKKGIVYRISCKDCHQSYIGQSGRSLQHRLKEHKRAVFCGNTNVSALAEHALSCGHEIDWENANILDHSDLFYPRLYLESWYIQKQNGLINQRSVFCLMCTKVLCNPLFTHSILCIPSPIFVHLISLLFALMMVPV